MNTRSASAGMIGRLMTMTAHPGKGEELAALLLRVAEGLHGFPGCEIYLISRDSADPDTVHVTEVWRDESDAQAALAAPPTAGAPAPADVLALLSSPPQRTDLTPSAEWDFPRRTTGADARRPRGDRCSGAAADDRS